MHLNSKSHLSRAPTSDMSNYLVSCWSGLSMSQNMIGYCYCPCWPQEMEGKSLLPFGIQAKEITDLEITLGSLLPQGLAFMVPEGFIQVSKGEKEHTLTPTQL